MLATIVCVKFKETTESDETITRAAVTTTVSQQTSAADDTTTITDSQTQTSKYHTSAPICS